MCNNCIHKAVCSKFAATGGHVRECEHFIFNLGEKPSVFTAPSDLVAEYIERTERDNQ